MESGDFILDPAEQSMKLENDPDALELDSKENQEVKNTDKISENEDQIDKSTNPQSGTS